MNIFILSKCIEKCVKYYNDSHVVKIILEMAQLLCSAHRILDTDVHSTIYKIAHKNHPYCIWVRSTSENYNYTFSLFMELCKEFTYRYDKIHLCQTKFQDLLKDKPKNIKLGAMTPMPLCMPDYCKVIDNDPDEYNDDDYHTYDYDNYDAFFKNIVKSYRKYYIYEKQHLAKWTKRSVPKWYKLKE